MVRYVALVCFSLIALCSRAQDSVWTLQRSVGYAIDNNLDLRQSVLNERLAQLQLQQSQLSQLPNASVGANVGRSYGRSVDPTTNQFINAGYTFAGLSGNADVLLFGWFQKRNTIAQNKLLAQSAHANWDQLRDDISLNVATAFLRILLAREQISIAESQVQFSIKQKEQTEAFVKAGRSPELDLAQMQAQVATDSSAYITALVNYNQSVLDMKALMNFDISAPFYASLPDLSGVEIAEIASLNPEEVYKVAQDHFGSVRSSKLQLDAAKKYVSVTKGNLYPQLALGGTFGTNYASTLQEIESINLNGGSVPTGNFVDIDGQTYLVKEPTFDIVSRTTPFGRQLSNNFRQNIALSLNVPLLNGWSSRTAVARARIDVQSREIELERSQIKLKQDVYKAFYDAKAALQKYYAADNAATSSERAYGYAQKRYELGLMNALELLTTQNNTYKAKAEAASAKYDMIFKLKVIDYYLGKEIKL